MLKFIVTLLFAQVLLAAPMPQLTENNHYKELMDKYKSLGGDPVQLSLDILQSEHEGDSYLRKLQIMNNGENNNGLLTLPNQKNNAPADTVPTETQ